MDVIIREPGPHSYFGRIQLGDVGYIRKGSFHLLFSAGCPSGGGEPGTDVPLGFEELRVEQIINPESRGPGYLTTGSVRVTRAIQTPWTPPSPTSNVPCVHSITPISSINSDVRPRISESGRGITFKILRGQGAALLTKYETLREDIQRMGNFEKYIKKHYASWVEFASTTGHGDNINPVLVTGVDRTKDFAMMSCSNDDDDDLKAGFMTSVPQDSPASAWGTWHTTGFVHTNCGPQLRPSPSSTQTAGSTASGNNNAEPVLDEYNQCVFVRYYTMRKRLGIRIPMIIKAGAGPHDLGSGDREDEGSPKVEVRSPSNSDSDPMSSLCDDDGGNDRSSVTSIESESDIAIHNTTPVRSLSSLSTSVLICLL
jgi:hypothetical protein